MVCLINHYGIHIKIKCRNSIVFRQMYNENTKKSIYKWRLTHRDEYMSYTLEYNRNRYAEKYQDPEFRAAENKRKAESRRRARERRKELASVVDNEVKAATPTTVAASRL